MTCRRRAEPPNRPRPYGDEYWRASRKLGVEEDQRSWMYCRQWNSGANAGQGATPVTGHPTVEELADAAEGLLPEERAAAVAQHLAECDDCRQTVAALGDVIDHSGRRTATGHAERRR